jgi:hypothetical protein
MSVAGTWNLTIDTPMGKQSAVLTLEETASGVTGVASADGESMPLDNVAVDGQRVTFKQAITKPMKLTVNFDLTVDGDTIGGKAKAGMFPASKVTGSRA